MGMPWWGAIAGGCCFQRILGIVALGFRVILLPFSVKASKQAIKMQEIQPQLNELMERARISQSMGLASDAGRVRDEMMVAFSSLLQCRTSTSARVFLPWLPCLDLSSNFPSSCPASWAFASSARPFPQCVRLRLTPHPQRPVVRYGSPISPCLIRYSPCRCWRASPRYS